MKHKHLKHLFTALLLLVATVATAHDFEVDGIYYNVLSEEDKTVEVTYKGSSNSEYSNEYTGSVVIPESVTYNSTTYSVTSIGDYAFYYCSGLTSITIPDGVTSIGDYAFYYCDDLSGELIIPGSVKKIGASAFGYCIKISSAKILNGVEIVGDAAFEHCRFSNIVIPASVKEIGDFAFFETLIRNVIFEDGESTLLLGNQKYSDGIGGGMFEGVPVKTVYIGRNLTFSYHPTKPESNAPFAHWYGAAYSSLQTAIIGPKVTSLPKYLFEDCKELKTVISYIPADELCAFDKTAVGFLPSEAILYVPINAKDAYSAIADWKDFGIINEFVEKDGLIFSITSNEDATLEVVNCVGNESSVIIPEKLEISGKEFCVTSIKSNTFYNCTYLENITIPNSIENIGYDAFYNTAWYNKQPDGCVYAGKVLYSYKGSMPENTSIVVKDGTLGITSSALNRGNITSITLPSSLKNIGTDVFLNSYNLADVYISDLSAWCNIDLGNQYSNPLSQAENLYLNGEKVTNLVIPEGVTSIGNYTFYGYDNLTSVAIPESVTSIGDYAFNGCSALTGALSLPTSLTNIGDNAFYNCKGLTGALSLPVSLTNIGKLAFYDCTGLTGTLSLSASLTNIGERAFYNCSGLTGDISIPGGVENINASTFYNCSGITDVVIGDGVANICESAFYGCSSLMSISIPASVTSIGNDVFRGCKALKDVRIEDGTETLSLGYYNTNDCLFYDCPLETLYLGRNLSNNYGSYYESPFYEKRTLKSVTIGNSVTSIGNYTFYGCTSLSNVEIPNSVTSIGNYAFYNCDGITNIKIPNCLTSIGECAFNSCNGLTSIEIPNSVTSIGSNAFYYCSGLKTIYNFSSLNISAGSTSHGYVAYYADNVINAPGGGFVGNFVFKVTNSDAVLCLYLGNADKIVLPADYKGSNYSVGENVFKNNTTITTVVIPDGVTSIGQNAFYGCTNLKTVNNFSSLDISAGSTDHGYIAYYTNYVEDYTNRGVVGNFIFETINAGSYNEYHQLVEYIEETDVVQKFDDVTIDASNSVSRSITVEAGEVLSLKWESEYGLDIVIIKGYDRVASDFLSTDYFYKFTESGNYEIRFYCYLSGKVYDFKTSRPLEVVLPKDYNGEKYSIANDAFSNTTISSVIISDGVTSIGNSAFEGCKNLTSIEIPGSVTSIGESTFDDCDGLTSVVIPNSITNIGSSAFSGCSGLKEVHISDLVAWCGIDFGNYSANPLYGAKKLYLNGDLVTELVIPEGVKEIKKNAFYNCTGLTSVEIPNSVTNIGNDAFYGCTGLKEVHISDLATWCNVDLGNNSANPLYCAKNLYLNGDLVTELVIPEGVKEIKKNTFYNCSALTNVEIPNSVTSIGDYAFYDCSALASVTSQIPADKLFEIYSDVFDNVDKTKCTLNVPYGAKTAYESTAGWNAFTNIVEQVVGGSCGAGVNWTLADGVLTITGNGAMDNFSSSNDLPWAEYKNDIQSVVIEEGVTSIGESAFRGCSGLTSIEIPNSVTGIGKSAFSGCSGLKGVYISDLVAWCNIDFGSYNANPLYYAKNLYLNNELLTEVTVPEGVTEIKNYAFDGYSGLTSVVIPNSVTSIGESAFDGCSGLTSVVIPNSVTAIGESAFYDCDGLTSVVIPNSVTSIGEGAFRDCSGLTSVTLGNSVTSIGDYAFYKCNALTSVTIPNGVKSIGNGTFERCTGLTSVTIPGSVTNIGGYAFSGCTKLESVTFCATTAPSVPDAVFNGISSTAVLRYPAGSDYSSWSSYFASTEMYGSVSGITLSASDVELNVNETYELTATVTPDDAFVKTISWSSSDNAIAVVDENGIVTAVAAGTATITATANDGSAVSASCNVIVIEEQGGDDEEVVVYENTIYVADTEAKTGTQVNLSICMDNVVDITSFQFDLYLPQGITIAKDEDDYHIIELSERATSRHTYESGDMPDGAVRVICYSTRNTIFSGNAGEVLSIPVNVSSDLADGEYEILVKEIELSTPAEVAYNVPVMTSSITVFSYITGDVNGDDKISVTDITGLVNLILDGAGYTANRAADVNEDGKISVTDITGIVNLILNSTNNATASAAPAQRTHRASSAGNNTMQIAPFAISAGEEKEISVLMDNPGDAFSAFQFNVYLPEGIELQSDEYGYLVDLGSRTTSRKHVVECAEQADGSILILCYSSKNSTFGGESGDVLVLPVKAAANLESGVYDIVMTDIEMARPDESNEFPADYTASVIAGEVRATELELNGYFTSESMDEISNAFANRNDITSIDISNAVHVDSEGNLTTGNSNTLVILPSNTAIANESNVVVDGMCENLQLTDNMAFGAPVDFTAVNVSYSRSFAAQTTATFVLPVSVPVDVINGKVYKLSAYEGDLIKFAKVTDAVLEANVPYVVVTDGAGELLNDNLRNAEVAATPAELSVSCANIKHVGSYNTLDVVSGTETYYGYSGGLFVKANNGTLAPFRTMIVAKGEASLSTSYRPEFGDGTTGIGINSAEDTDVIYFDIQGRRVDRVENGVYIINGKKTFIK